MPLPTTDEELDSLLTTMQSNGAPKEAMQKVFDAYNARVPVSAPKAPAVPAPTGQPFDTASLYQDPEVKQALLKSQTQESPSVQGPMTMQEEIAPPTPAQAGMEAAGYGTSQPTREGAVAMEAAGFNKEAEEMGQNVPSPIDIAAGIGKTISAPAIVVKNVLEAAPDVAKLAMLATKVSQGTATPEESQEVATLIQRANKNLEEGMGSVETVGRIGAGTNPVLQGSMSAAKTLATDLAKGDDLLPAVGESLWEGGKDAALTMVFNKLLGSPKVKGPPLKRAQLAGLTDADIQAATKGGVSFDRGIKIIDAAVEGKGIHGGTGAFEQVADETFLPTLNKLEAQESLIGKKIGEITNAMRGRKTPQVDVFPERKIFEQDLRELGVKFRGGKPVLKGSKIEGLGADNLIKEAWDFVSPKKGETGTAFKNMFDVYNKVGNLREKIFKGKANMELGQAERALANLRTGLRGRIVNMRGEYGKLAQGYAELDDFLTEISKATGDQVKNREFLRKLMSNASSMSKEQLNKMSALAEKYGITEGKNIMNEARLAQAAEDVAKFTPAGALQGQVARGVPTSKAGIASRVGGMIVDKTIGKAIGTPVANLKKLLETPQEQISPSMIEKLLSNAPPELKRGLMEYLKVTSGLTTK